MIRLVDTGFRLTPQEVAEEKERLYRVFKSQRLLRENLTNEIKYRDDSFICAQANKTILYNKETKSLYVFGHAVPAVPAVRDDPFLSRRTVTSSSPPQTAQHQLCHIKKEPKQPKVVSSILNPTNINNHVFPNCSLFKIDTSHFKLEASGPNCSYFSFGSDIYLFASRLYIRQCAKVVEKMYIAQTEKEMTQSAIDEMDGKHRRGVFREQISCSRTHSSILYETTEGMHPIRVGSTSESASIRLIQFNEKGVGVEIKLDDINNDHKWEIFCGINCTFIIHNGVIIEIPLDKNLISDTDRDISSLPARFRTTPGKKKPIKIVCGGAHNMVLYDDGSFDGWGDNSVNQIPSIANSIFNPKSKPKLRVTDLVCGNQHTLCLLENGQVAGFGDSTFSQKNDYFPRSLSRVIQIACGDNHSLALLDNRDVMGWGNNTQNQLGNIEIKINGTLIFYYINRYAKSIEDSIEEELKKQSRGRGGSKKKKKSQNKKKISKKLKIKY